MVRCNLKNFNLSVFMAVEHARGARNATLGPLDFSVDDCFGHNPEFMLVFGVAMYSYKES